MDGGLCHCTGVRDQDHPHGTEMQKRKWLSGEALQIAVKRRDVKGKESKLAEEISINSDMQMTPPLWQKVKNN